MNIRGSLARGAGSPAVRFARLSRLRGALLLLASLVMLSCGGAAVPLEVPGVGAPPPEATSAAAPAAGYYETQVLYGTDRARTDSSDPYRMFGPDHGELSLGSCVVAIPRDHEAGVLDTHSFWRLYDTPATDVTLTAVEPLDRARFVADLQARVAASHGKSALVFIHGFNTAFSDAIRRTAQLAFDLNFDGAAITYSWPSRGGILSYEADTASADWTGVHLHEFLALVASQSGATDASLIVHSMGNRALAAALNDLAVHPTVGAMTFHEIVLAAPDLDRETFKTSIAPAFAQTHARVTLYASNHDEALRASGALHGGFARAGEANGGIAVVNGVESVDASAADQSLIGHSYFAEATSVLSDIHAVLLEHLPPAVRPRLAAIPGDAGTFWRFMTGAPANH